MALLFVSCLDAGVSGGGGRSLGCACEFRALMEPRRLPASSAGAELPCRAVLALLAALQVQLSMAGLSTRGGQVGPLGCLGAPQVILTFSL